MSKLYSRCFCHSCTQCFCHRCTRSISVTVVLTVFLSQLYSRCFCHSCTHGVSVTVVLTVFLSQLYSRCFCHSCTHRVSVTVVLAVFLSQLYSQCFCHSCTHSVSVTVVLTVFLRVFALHFVPLHVNVLCNTPGGAAQHRETNTRRSCHLKSAAHSLKASPRSQSLTCLGGPI